MRGGLIGATALSLAFLACVAQAEAEPRKLGLSDLSASQQKILWERVDDDAGYAALLTLCQRDPSFERRFVAVVEPCVERATIDQVVRFYRSRYASVLSRAARHPCDDPVFARNRIADKLASMLDQQVAQAKTYCESYLFTGMAGRR